MAALSFLTLKAYGDFVIAYNCLRGRISSYSHYIGEHLQELAQAVDCHWQTSVLQHGERSVPAAFDLRRQGIVAGAKSLLGLRRAVERIPNDTVLVFDRLTTRTKIIASDRPAICLPKEENIYNAYDAILEDHGQFLPRPVTPRIENRDGAKVRIFAGSRIDSKKIPLDLCTDLVKKINERNEIAEVVSLVGEYPALEASDLPKLILPRSFSQIIDAVSDAKKVISADSLTAHLAELKGHKPVVLSPVANSYWLPRSSFRLQSWALFHQGTSAALGALERAGG